MSFHDQVSLHTERRSNCSSRRNQKLSPELLPLNRDPWRRNQQQNSPVEIHESIPPTIFTQQNNYVNSNFDGWSEASHSQQLYTN